MKSNIEIYEDTNKLLGVSQTEFATDFCQKSSSYIRVMRTDEKRRMPTHVLVNIWEKLDAVKSYQMPVTQKAIAKLQEKIAKEIVYRNTKEQHLKLRKMLVGIIDSVNTKRTYDAPPILIM